MNLSAPCDLLSGKGLAYQFPGGIEPDRFENAGLVSMKGDR